MSHVFDTVNSSFNQALKTTKRPKWEVADIFREFGEAYRSLNALPLSHLKVMHAIEVCRTAYLGGHIQKCDKCDYQRCAYNSCRNRHCPKCQALAKTKWLEDRKAEMLPVKYFHMVFTLPHELNPLILQNKRVLLDILFKAVSETLLTFARNHLKGKIGFITILHTWDQRLLDHFHLHCLIPAAALSFDQQRFIIVKRKTLFCVKMLSKVFRGKYLSFLKRAYRTRELDFHGDIKTLREPKAFQNLISLLYSKKWVVYSKGSFKEAHTSKESKAKLQGATNSDLLDYLARYTHRVAICNHRILTVKGEKVTFSYKNRRNGNRTEKEVIDAPEFIRRFLLHVLPDGFMKIRHYGFLANRCKRESLDQCRKLMKVPKATEGQCQEKVSVEEMMLRLTGKDITRCPCCQTGTLIIVERLEPAYARYYPGKHYQDSS